MSSGGTGNLRGAGLMALAALFFAAEALAVRALTDRGVPVALVLLARAAGQLAWTLPSVAASGGFGVFRTRRPGLHLLRGACSLATWALYFLSFALLDLATATVLSFCNVLFTAALAGPVLGERVGPARWAGTLAGLAGVAIMLRPWEAGGAGGVPLLGAAVALAAALAWCGITLTSRALTATERTATVVGWVGLVTTAGALPLAFLAWRPLPPELVAALLAFAAATPAILWLVTEALRHGEASAVAPLQYLRLPVVAALGWATFGEVPDGPAWLGASAVLGGAVVVTVAEARERRRAAATAARAAPA